MSVHLRRRDRLKMPLDQRLRARENRAWRAEVEQDEDEAWADIEALMAEDRAETSEWEKDYWRMVDWEIIDGYAFYANEADWAYDEERHDDLVDWLGGLGNYDDDYSNDLVDPYRPMLEV